MVIRLKTMMGIVIGLLFGAANGFADYLPTIADFNRCPTIGGSVACGVLFVVNPKVGADYVVNAYAALSAPGVPAVKPYDGADDSVYGVLNKSGAAIDSLSLGFFGPQLGATGQPLFALDGDGICSPLYAAASGGACGAGIPAGNSPNGYEGPNTYFSFINNADVRVDPRGGGRSGTIAFAGGGLANNGFAYFSLEDLFPIGGCVLNCPSSISGAAEGEGGVSTLALTGDLQIAGVPIQATVLRTAASAAAPEPGTLTITLPLALFVVGRRIRRRAQRGTVQ